MLAAALSAPSGARRTPACRRSCSAAAPAAPAPLAPRSAAQAPRPAALRRPACGSASTGLAPAQPRRAAAVLPAALPASLPGRWETPAAFTASPLEEPATETEYGRSGRGLGSSSSPPSSPPSSSSSSGSSSSTSAGLKPLPRDVEGVADDASLHNPLQRMERLGTAWFGTIFELDGVCVEYECGDGARAWQALAAEEGKPPPPLWALKKADGMKNEQVRAGRRAGRACVGCRVGLV